MNYSTFIPILEDTFVDIIRQLAVFNTKQNLLLGNKPTDFTRWLIPPQAVYTFYQPLRNELVLPAGMLQSPLFGPTKDLCVNYGAIGATIGRECKTFCSIFIYKLFVSFLFTVKK
jgi:putative endopeptidase